ncbi:MAG: NeuD/PglB/VioB family sugar acetyltransferase [Pseudomonadota bacterium]|nr:NeuD/PglB/VioB family sugar acetyltransferase [Pseudomonadota bacterium]
MSNLVIVGAGGFGLEVAGYAEDVIRSDKVQLTIKGFLDDTKPQGARHAGYPVLGTTEIAAEPGSLYVIAVGEPAQRETLAQKLAAKGAQFASILHPTCYVAGTAKIGAGVIIAPFAFVGPEAVIGNHAVMNVFASAGHEALIGDYAVLSPYAALHGNARLGDGAFMGSHACVTGNISLGERAVLAAGSVAYNSVPPGVTAIGNPAAFRKIS